MATSKNDPSKRNKNKKVDMYNGKEIFPVMYYDENVSFVSAADAKGDLVLVNGNPMPWGSFQQSD